MTISNDDIHIKLHGTAVYKAVKQYMSNSDSGFHKAVTDEVNRVVSEQIKSSVWYRLSNNYLKKGEYDVEAERYITKFVETIIKEKTRGIIKQELEGELEKTVKALVKKQLKSAVKEMFE